ncbi:MAG: response regulator [Proteobacteria bacterium]|nr:response regulator [Pseudomonadota bacterium]
MSSQEQDKIFSDDPHIAIQFYQDVIFSLPHLVYLIDKNCTVIGVNANMLNLLNLESSEDILGIPLYKKLQTQSNWPIDRIDLLKHNDINALLAGEARMQIEEEPVQDKNGNFTYYLSSRIPIFDDEQKIIGLVCVLEDISYQKELNQQLEKVKQQLQLNNAEKEPLQKDEESLTLSDYKKPPRVLMVEDNSTAQRAAQALLMQLDCHVDVADSGDKAAMLFKPGKYDLVFMDIGLEDTSGYVVSKKIRQLEKGTLHHVPIIALTGYEADVVKYDCDDYSMEGALTKPLTTEQAKQIIQHYIYHIDIPVRGLKSIKNKMDSKTN